MIVRGLGARVTRAVLPALLHGVLIARSGLVRSRGRLAACVAVVLLVLPASATAATTDALPSDASAVQNCAPMPDAYGGSDELAAELRELRREQVRTCRYVLAALGRPASTDGPQPDAPAGARLAAIGDTLADVLTGLDAVKVDTTVPLSVALTRGGSGAEPLHTTSPAVGDTASSATFVRLTEDDDVLGTVYDGLRYAIWFGSGLLLVALIVPALMRTFRA